MPLVITETDLDRLIRESEAHAAKYRHTRPQDIPAADRKAQIDREIAMFGLASPEEKQAILDENNDSIGFKPAVSDAPGWNGRKKEAA